MLKPISVTSSLLVVLSLLSTPAVSSAKVFKVDAAHTSVTFKIRHFVTKVQGRFSGFAGTVEFDPDAPTEVKVNGSIDVSTINTDNAKRDGHLRGEDFFDVAKYPKITFTGGKLTDFNGDKTQAKLHGELTMHGVTKAVVLDVEFHGTVKTHYDELKAGLTAQGTINRKDFNITWNKTLDAGGYVLGNDVAFLLEVELTELEESAE